MHTYKRGTTFVYRRRIPKSLQQYLRILEFKKSLSKDLKTSKYLASTYDALFSKMLLSIHLNMGIGNLIKELGLGDTVQPIQKNIFEVFLDTKQDTSKSSYKEYKTHLDLIQLLLPKNLKGLSYRDLDDFKQALTRLPKRNIQKYRVMSLKQIVKLDVPMDDRISIKSRNEYLKTLRALLKFAYERNYIGTPMDIKLFTNKVSARNQKQVLDNSDLVKLFNHSDIRVSSMSKILYYSGMRLSEVYKCSVSNIEGVLFFNLMDTSIELKNEHSYRVIPVHSSIEYDVDKLMSDALSVKSVWHTRKISSELGGGTKTLYSLRHTFATQLGQAGVDVNVIGELMGHSHTGMTAGRYIKGFGVNVLKQSIENLGLKLPLKASCSI